MGNNQKGFTKTFLNLMNNAAKTARCCFPKTDGVTIIQGLDKIFIKDGDTIAFNGDGTETDPLTGELKLSTDTRSKYVFKQTPGGLFVDGFKLVDADKGSGLRLWDMKPGTLTDAYEPITKVGTLSTAVITKVGDFDNLVVANQADPFSTYLYPTNRVWAAKPIDFHMKVKVVALGGTLPALGFRTVCPGGPYSNFCNPQKGLYVNLNTGAITTLGNGNWTVTQYNGFSGAVAAGEIVDVYFRFLAFDEIKLTIVRNNLNGDTSVYRLKIPAGLNSASEHQDLFYVGAIINDGTYQVLELDGTTGDYEKALIALAGDSLMSGGRQHYTDSIQYKLEQLIPYRVSSFAAGTCYLAGMHAVLKDIIKSRPKVVAFDNGLDALFQGYVNPTNPNFATWDASMKKYVDTLIAFGIEPILVAGSDNNYLYTDATKDLFITWWQTNYPGRRYVTTTVAEVAGKMDGTNFHYGPLANDLIVSRIITQLESLNLL